MDKGTLSAYIKEILKEKKVKEGTCGYDRDVKTGKNFSTPGGMPLKRKTIGEDNITFSKGEMDKLHKDGKLEKGGHSFKYKLKDLEEEVDEDLTPNELGDLQRGDSMGDIDPEVVAEDNTIEALEALDKGDIVIDTDGQEWTIRKLRWWLGSPQMTLINNSNNQITEFPKEFDDPNFFNSFELKELVNENEFRDYSLLDFFKEMQSFPAAGVEAKDIVGAAYPPNKKKTVKNTPALQDLLDQWMSGRYDEDPGYLVDELRGLLESVNEGLTPETAAKAEKIKSTMIGKNRDKLFKAYGKDAEKVAHGRAITQAKKATEKEVNEEKVDWPGEINYGDKKYILFQQKDGKVTYEHEKHKGDKLTFGSKKEMDDFLGDYTAPKGGTQSSQFEESISETITKEMWEEDWDLNIDAGKEFNKHSKSRIDALLKLGVDPSNVEDWSLHNWDTLPKSVMKLLPEVYSEKQRKWACAQDEPKFDEMCKDTAISKKKTMKENRLSELIKTALKGPIKEEFGGEGLTLGKLYNVFDPVLRQLNLDFEYVGFDRNEIEHVFVSHEAGGDTFVNIADEDVDDFVEEPLEGTMSDPVTEEKDWIQKAIKRPGALHRELGVPKDKDIPKGKINKAISRLKKKDKDDEAKGTQLPAGDERELRQLNLAKTLSKFNEGKLAERVFKKLREDEETTSTDQEEKSTITIPQEVKTLLSKLEGIEDLPLVTMALGKIAAKKELNANENKVLADVFTNLMKTQDTNLTQQLFSAFKQIK